MKKRFIAMALAGAMIVGCLAGCNTSGKKAEENTEAGDGYIDVELDAKEYVKLGEYKNLKIKSAPVEVTNEQIDARIEEDREEAIYYEKVEDRDTVGKDDTVNLNYVCTVNGEIVEDLSNDDMDVDIGSGELEFFTDATVEDQLIGAKVGETKKISGTFSDELYVDQVSGKKGEMEITINYLTKEVIPEFDDAYIKENTEYTSVKEYREAIKKELEGEAASYAEEENKYALLEKAVDNSEKIKDFPEDAIEAERNNSILEVSNMAMYMGMEIGESDEEIEAFIKENYGVSLDEYVENNLKTKCVYDLILKAEKMEVSDKEIDDYVEQEIKSGGYASEEEFYEGTSKDEVRSELEQSRIFDVLVSTANIEK